ncbi:MAG: carboxy-S-adenosyl-L-methionine synthase CmoA [Desulfofustis sp.]
MKDRLYQVDTVPEDFDFNERVVEVFDDMLDRSIPCYKKVIRETGRLLAAHLNPGDLVCDLGCATGTALFYFARELEDQRLRFVGLDSSPAMLAKVRLKAEFYAKDYAVSFQKADITKINMEGTGAFILNYTLQFIRPVLRPSLITQLYDNLRPGGLLILSEKTILEDKRLNRTFIDIHHDFKRAQGYSDLEIARKREALENILIPFTLEENMEMLAGAGFKPITTFLQWFNFSSFVALKPS